MWYCFFGRWSRANFPLPFLDVVSDGEYKTSTLHKFGNASSGVIHAESPIWVQRDTCGPAPSKQAFTSHLTTSSGALPFFWNQGQETDVSRDSSALTMLSQHQNGNQFIAGSLQILPISCHVYSGRLDVSARPPPCWWHKALKSPKRFLNRRKAYLHDKPQQSVRKIQPYTFRARFHVSRWHYTKAEYDLGTFPKWLWHSVPV